MASPSNLTLYSLHLSPWSERARWALEHHGLEYRKIEHVPFLGERRLRRVLGNPERRATVPVLVADGRVLSDSWEIALYADQKGRGTPLIGGAQEAVRHWHDLAERALSAGRAVTIASALGSDAALEETVAAPRALRPLLRPLARFGMQWIARKYQLDLSSEAAGKQALREALGALRSALGVGEYLLGHFSYADVIAATLLQGVSPVSDRYLRLGPATRSVWTQPDLAASYADLVAWRDRLYERHRRAVPAATASAGGRGAG